MEFWGECLALTAIGGPDTPGGIYGGNVFLHVSSPRNEEGLLHAT
jgi:hypothetical protein